MTLEQLQERLALYLAAEAAILKSQEYTVGEGATARRLKRADLAEVRAEIHRLDLLIQHEQGKSAGVRRVYQVRPA